LFPNVVVAGVVVAGVVVFESLLNVVVDVFFCNSSLAGSKV